MIHQYVLNYLTHTQTTTLPAFINTCTLLLCPNFTPQLWKKERNKTIQFNFLSFLEPHEFGDCSNGNLRCWDLSLSSCSSTMITITIICDKTKNQWRRAVVLQYSQRLANRGAHICYTAVNISCQP